MAFQSSANRLWKKLTPSERLAAAAHFWKEPPQDLLGAALGVLVRARRLRPQVARSLPAETQTRILSSVLDPGEQLAAALLVTLHLGERRALLTAFLDAAGLPHEQGILKEGAASGTALAEDRARAGVTALKDFPREQVETYLNTLWLQDREQWAVLEKAPEWLACAGQGA